MKTNKKGFTIVELVIVIAVIAILAAVLIPTFSGVVSKANQSAALQEATSVMKSSLAMSTSGTLDEGTLFVIGGTSGIDYEFEYKGNKITEKAKNTTTDEYDALTAVAGGTKGTGFDRIIISTDALKGSSWDASNCTKVKAIIKDAFGLTSDVGDITSTPSGDSSAKYGLSINSVVIGVYVNSDYPTDAVTFVPATKAAVTPAATPAKLTALSITNTTDLTPSFASGKNDYTATASGTSGVITATAEENATFTVTVTGTGASFDGGTNTITWATSDDTTVTITVKKTGCTDSSYTVTLAK